MRGRLALVTVLAALVPCGGARAATTVGSDLTKAATATVCGPAVSCTYFTGDATTGAPAAVAPFDGVVVRWRVKSATAATGTRLRALRPAGAGKYVSAGLDDPHALQIGTNAFAARLPVKAGDVIGIDDSSSAKIFASPVPTAAYYFQPLGAGSVAQAPAKQSSRELLLSADIEPDADGDGYGDETQDLCPTDETRHSACLSNLSVSMVPTPAPLTVGRPLTFTIKVSNEGPSTAQDVGLSVALPFSATPIQARAGRGFCRGGYTIECHLGQIARSDSGTVVIVVRPEVVGTVVVTAVTTTSTDQSSTDDDSRTSDVTVLPVTLRMLDLRLSRAEFRVGGGTAIRWFMTDAAAVKVALEQVTRRGRIRPAGSFAVRGRQGSNVVSIRGRLPGRKRLKPGSYRFAVSAATPDGRVAAPAHLSFTVRRRHGS
jgi:uncharacterized repeat protein (TIGR01451 family)